MNLPENLRHKFSHIYVEEEILSFPETEEILSHFSDAIVIPVRRYTDVFERTRQSLPFQQVAQNLILAGKHDQRIYQGSPVCQNFDERYFYYCAPVMNCLFDCEYCWLKGMYASANLVVFLNQEDFIHDTEKLLKEHPVYLCVSYETDLPGLESLLHLCRWWGKETVKHEDLTIELRTKASYQKSWEEIPVNDRIIFAFTLSPDEVIQNCEHGTASLDQRIQTIRKCLSEGRQVRLCFDPMIPVKNRKEAYCNMIEKIVDQIDLKQIRDVSIGTFRISKQYLKKMRKAYPDSAVIQYPYVCDHGFYHLPDDLQKEMEEGMIALLSEYMDRKKIFVWKN